MKNSILSVVWFVVPAGCLLLGCGHGPNDASGNAPADAASDAPSFTVDMFDDFEDGNRDILPSGGRFGHWWNYGDPSEGTNTIAVVALDPATERHATYQTESTMALRVQASGYTMWGSGFSSDVQGTTPYDVASYTGLVFWAKSLSPRPNSIHVGLPDVNNDPSGGICDPSADAPMEKACYDAFGQNVDLTSTWQRYHLPFWSLQQGGWGLKTPTGLATHQILKVAFASNPGIAYDYYIDDVGFYKE